MEKSKELNEITSEKENEKKKASKRRKDKGSGGVSRTRRKDSLYQGYTYVADKDGNKSKKYVYAKTKAERTEKLRAIDFAESSKVTTEKNSLTYREFANDWLFDNLSARGLRTNESYESILRIYMFPVIGEKKLVEIMQADVQRVLSRAAEMGRSSETQKRIKALLSLTFKNARANHLIIDTPVVDLIKIINDKKTKYLILNEEQEKHYLKAIEGSEYETLLNLVYFTGVRISEAVPLNWVDLDFLEKAIDINKAAGRVTITSRDGTKKSAILCAGTKTYNSIRKIKVCDILTEQLKMHKEKYKEKAASSKTSLAFSSRNNTFLDARNVRRSMQNCIIKYNNKNNTDIPLKTGLHTFRHTLASKLYFKFNVTSKAISAYLGHYDEDFTKRKYIHSYENEQDEIMDCMNSSSFSAEPKEELSERIKGQ